MLSDRELRAIARGGDCAHNSRLGVCSECDDTEMRLAAELLACRRAMRSVLRGVRERSTSIEDHCKRHEDNPYRLNGYDDWNGVAVDLCWIADTIERALPRPPSRSGKRGRKR